MAATTKSARERARTARAREERAARAERASEAPPGRPEREVEGSPRTGAKKTVMNYVAELPRFLRLLWGLIGDRRVAVIDKVLVAGAIAYIVAPIDWIPDFIPFLGEVDDIYLLVLSLQRLMQNAGRVVLLSHWTGNPEDLRAFNLRKALMAAAFFLPRRVRRRLRVMGR